MKNRPVVTFSLPPILADFCRHLFKEDKNGNLVLSTRKDIGKMIYSNLSASDLPVRRPLLENPISFVIPTTAANHYILGGRFLFVSKWGEEKIEDFIEPVFKFRVRRHFEIGYQKGYTQKRIIEGILWQYNIKENKLNFEAIKKMDYRNNRKLRETVAKSIELSSI